MKTINLRSKSVTSKSFKVKIKNKLKKRNFRQFIMQMISINHLIKDFRNNLRKMTKILNSKMIIKLNKWRKVHNLNIQVNYKIKKMNISKFMKMIKWKKKVIHIKRIINLHLRINHHKGYTRKVSWHHSN